MARIVRKRKRSKEPEDPFIYTTMTIGEKGSWKACEEALRRRHCGAEMLKMPSGCPIFRVPKDKAHRLDDFAFTKPPAGQKQIAAPYLIPHGTKNHTASIFMLENPFPWTEGEWKPLKPISDENTPHLRRSRRRKVDEKPVSGETTPARRRRRRTDNGKVLPDTAKKKKGPRTRRL